MLAVLSALLFCAAASLVRSRVCCSSGALTPKHNQPQPANDAGARATALHSGAALPSAVVIRVTGALFLKLHRSCLALSSGAQ
jgi:hypothetical protein